MTQKQRNPVRLGIIVMVVAVGLMVMGFLQVAQRLLEPDRDTVLAHFVSTRQLKPNDPVRVAGVQVGKVQRITLDDDGRGATVEMGVESDGLPLYKDATATINERNLLGGSFLINVNRGTAASGKLGSTGIPRNHTGFQTELEDIQGIARGDAGTGLTTMFKELGRGLEDPEAPAGLVEEVDQQSPDLSTGLTAARGVRPDRDLQVLIEQSARTVDALDDRTGALTRLIGGLGATLETTAARREDLRTMFRIAPGVLQRSGDTLARLDGSLGELDPLVARLRDSASNVAPAVRALRPTVSGLDAVLNDARPLLHSLRPAAQSLAGLSRNARPLLDGLDPSFRRLDKTILPYFNRVDDRTDHTPAEMVGPTFSVLGSAGVGQFDNNGHFVRFPASVGEGALNSLPCRTYITNPDAAQLVACDSLKQVLTQLFEYSPGGIPGSAPAAKDQP